MKVVITVTAVYDFPDDVEIEELIEGEEIGRHIVVDGRKFQPVIDFSEYEEDESEPWKGDSEEELEKAYERIDDSLEAEEYTIIEVGGAFDDD